MPLLTIAAVAAATVLPAQETSTSRPGIGRQRPDVVVVPQIFTDPYGPTIAPFSGGQSSVQVTGARVTARGSVRSITADAQGHVTFFVDDVFFALCGGPAVTASGAPVADPRLSLLSAAVADRKPVSIVGVETTFTTSGPLRDAVCALEVTLEP